MTLPYCPWALSFLQAFILYIVADFFWILLEPRAVPSK